MFGCSGIPIVGRPKLGCCVGAPTRPPNRGTAACAPPSIPPIPRKNGLLIQPPPTADGPPGIPGTGAVREGIDIIGGTKRCAICGAKPPAPKLIGAPTKPPTPGPDTRRLGAAPVPPNCGASTP